MNKGLFSILFFISFWFFCSENISAREVHFYTKDSVLLAVMKEGKVFHSTSDDIIYSIQGNIIFNGDSYNKEDIKYLINSKGLFEKSKGYLLDKNQEHTIMSFKKGRFHLGKSSCALETDMLGFLKEDKNGRMVFHDAQSDEVIGYTNHNSVKDAELILGFLIFSEYFDLENRLMETLKQSASTNESGGQFLGSIKSLWNHGADTEWIWDGKILRLRWANNPYYEWFFDGEILRPNWQHNIQEEYTWDGEVFKPLWRSSSAEEWIWDGNRFKPMWNSDVNREFVIDENRAMPYWSNDKNMEWTISGEIPLPVIAIVILGIAYR